MLCCVVRFRYRITLGWAWIGVLIALICVSVCSLFCMINRGTPLGATPNAPDANANANANANAGQRP